MSNVAPTLAINPEFPPALACLFEKARYKVLYGGRGGAKSWGVARWLLIRAIGEPLRVLCAREVQKSIQQSVKKLLEDQIKSLGLAPLFEIQRDVIRCLSTGAEFFFEGLKDNADKIRSYEGIDVCWVEEAHSVSEGSWKALTPTIRKPGSEIVVTFNPQYDSDATYQRFVKKKPSNSIIKKISWRDNPWFPDELRVEMEDMRREDEDSWLNVWEGHTKQILSGAVYAKEIRRALGNGQITRVPYNPSLPVHTFWDLGWADKTTIWFAQLVGFEFHIIDYYENSQESIDHYLKVLQSKPYIYGDTWLPHDARAKQLGSGRSTEELIRAKGWKVRIVPRLKLEDGINAARTIFPQCYFDESKCEDGLKALKSYRFDVQGDIIENQTFSRQPLHDWASHAADAFRYLAIGLRQPKARGAVGKVLEAAADVADDWFGGSPKGLPSPNGWLR